ncbi:MAG: ribosome recycling factor [Patescibacteria group bacterium]
MSQHHISAAEALFQKTIEHLKTDLAKLQTGRATPALVEDVLVEAYGSMQPIKAMASISIPDARSLLIQPWDKSQLSSVEKAIIAADIGVTPVNDGINVRINMPQLTEERRKDLVKVVGKMVEDARIGVRHSRSEAHAAFKALKAKSEMTEDDVTRAEKTLQEKVDACNRQIEEIGNKKEEDVMRV